MDDGHKLARRLAIGALWLGFALGGFFDGILLHQILQWHHLLSALETRGAPFADLRFQILADGYFHILMYVVAAIALRLLWHARRGFDRLDAGRQALAWLLTGFGAWHIVDAVASHWIAQIHRVRMDAANPLLWDMGWLIGFGVLPLALGLWLRRSRGGRAGAGPGSGRGAALSVLTILSCGAGLWALQKPPGQDFTTIVFAPVVPFDDAAIAVAGASEAILWFNGEGVFVVSGLKDPLGISLYGRGALLVTSAGVPPGCFAWRA